MHGSGRNVDHPACPSPPWTFVMAIILIGIIGAPTILCQLLGITLRGCDLRSGSLRPKNLAKQKYVGEERTQMHRCIQVVDQLGADSRLTEYKFHGGKRITRIAVQHSQEGLESVFSFEVSLPNRSRTALCES